MIWQGWGAIAILALLVIVYRHRAHRSTRATTPPMPAAGNPVPVSPLAKALADVIEARAIHAASTPPSGAEHATTETSRDNDDLDTIAAQAHVEGSEIEAAQEDAATRLLDLLLKRAADDTGTERFYITWGLLVEADAALAELTPTSPAPQIPNNGPRE